MKKRYEDGIIPRKPTEARADIARQLRDTRQGLNMTQQVLADRAGTQKSNISRMESGNYNPSLDFLVNVASCLGKSVSIKLE